MTVIVGFDGSKAATEAMRWAGRYAAAHRDRLHVVRAWQYPATSVLPVPARAPLVPPTEVEHDLQRDLDEAVTEALTDGLDVTTEIVRGSAAAYLIDRASKSSVRALVLGSRGLGGFAELVLGSVTRACLDHSTAPVVVVPHGYDASTPLRRVLVGVDGSRAASQALRWACATAATLQADLVATTVLVPDQAELRPDVAAELWARAEANLADWCDAEEAARVGRRVLTGDPRTALLEIIEREGCDLVVVGSRGLGPVAKLLLGSVATALAHHAPIPLAVVPFGRSG
jgi:nucleotide-binding universal stress UspA family protein